MYGIIFYINHSIDMIHEGENNDNAIYLFVKSDSPHFPDFMFSV